MREMVTPQYPNVRCSARHCPPGLLPVQLLPAHSPVYVSKQAQCEPVLTSLASVCPLSVPPQCELRIAQLAQHAPSEAWRGCMLCPTGLHSGLCPHEGVILPCFVAEPLRGLPCTACPARWCRPRRPPWPHTQPCQESFGYKLWSTYGILGDDVEPIGAPPDMVPARTCMPELRLEYIASSLGATATRAHACDQGQCRPWQWDGCPNGSL